MLVNLKKMVEAASLFCYLFLAFSERAFVVPWLMPDFCNYFRADVGHLQCLSLNIKARHILINGKYQQQQVDKALHKEACFLGFSDPLTSSLMDPNSELLGSYSKRQEYIILADLLVTVHLPLCCFYLLQNVLVAIFLLLLLLPTNLFYPQRPEEDLYYKFTLELPSTKRWFCSQVSGLVMKGISHHTCEI